MYYTPWEFFRGYIWPRLATFVVVSSTAYVVGHFIVKYW